MDRFQEKLLAHKVSFKKSKIEVLQVNVGKLCNLTCSHCHVEAGPTKTKENMDFETAEEVVRLMDVPSVHTFDITGGAPEMNPHFKYLITEAKKRNLRVIDRCNLTVIFEKGMKWLPQFLHDNEVEIVASLPCYLQKNVDSQRGKGTYEGSIKALQVLNRLGYGLANSGLTLNLVYNPVEAHLPPSQAQLEQDYKKRLKGDWGIEFNKLFTITNMPITRYAKFLKAYDQLKNYEELLLNSFNLATVEGLMCRNTLSVGWDGKLYDCDFNQMIGMQIKNGRPLHAGEVDIDDLEGFDILTGNHCFGCTAGAGSSCQGALK